MLVGELFALAPRFFCCVASYHVCGVSKQMTSQTMPIHWQDCSISSALAMDLLQSCAKPSKYLQQIYWRSSNIRHRLASNVYTGLYHDMFYQNLPFCHTLQIQDKSLVAYVMPRMCKTLQSSIVPSDAPKAAYESEGMGSTRECRGLACILITPTWTQPLAWRPVIHHVEGFLIECTGSGWRIARYSVTSDR